MRGVDDNAVDGDQGYTIVTAPSGSDPVYRGLDANVTNRDLDHRDISVSPSSLDFGQVLVGQLTRKGVTITNLSTSTLTLGGSVSISGRFYTIQSGAAASAWRRGPRGPSSWHSIRWACCRGSAATGRRHLPRCHEPAVADHGPLTGIGLPLIG